MTNSERCAYANQYEKRLGTGHKKARKIVENSFQQAGQVCSNIFARVPIERFGNVKSNQNR